MVLVKIPESAQQQWHKAGLAWADVVPETESAEYCAHRLTLGGRSAIFRVAKTTPTKAGQFVTLWQRSLEGPIRPFDMHDGVELFVVQAALGAGLGEFVFPLGALARHGVVSVDGKGGKRAMRVYAPDVVTTSVQARRTQKWQCEYFLPHDASVAQARELYSA
ncbi:MepB domain containing protein [Arthrobacter glacialis]|uniref:MepB domain containing protein n=1 Tax=Arthrobacter glacialis TaxID=1664 RepID=A0A2S3ZWF8_ARTGL|nr:MepB domain containing protein [Arthrobacter glacialis]